MLLVVAAVGASQCRLALTPDRAISNDVRKTVEGAGSLETVRERLGRKYTVLGEGIGPGFFRKVTFSLNADETNLVFFHVVVGRYHSPPFFFETSVEAQVVVDRHGAVRDVAIRRTTDTL